MIPHHDLLLLIPFLLYLLTYLHAYLLDTNYVMCARFSDYDGELLSEFVSYRLHSPDALYSALFRENFTVDDTLRICRALNHLMQ